MDSDEETEAVIAAITRHRPTPMAQHVHVDLRRRNERIQRKQAITEHISGKNGRGLFAIGETAVTPWNSDGRYGDHSAATFRNSSGPISDARMANINSGMFDNYELPTLDKAAEVVGSSAWKLRQAGKQLNEQIAAEEEARKNGLPLPPEKPYRRTVGHDGKGIIHVDEQ